MFSLSTKLEHADSRGEIYSIELPNGHELMLLHSVPKSFRGGHHHDCDEVVVILAGEMVYHKRETNASGEEVDTVRTLVAGDVSFNPAKLIHMGEFVQDTWLIEYKFAKKGEWSQEEYEPFREKVRAALPA